MAGREREFRIAVRQFDAFESAIRKQWLVFDSEARTGLQLRASAFDLHSLHKTLFEENGFQNGDWDVAFVSTDWIAEGAATGALADLSPNLKADPPEGYPHAWPVSLLNAQTVGGKVMGLPYHDGPECLIYRKDWLEASRLPVTWDDFHQLARELTRPEDNVYGTVFAAFPDGHNTVYDFCLQLWSRGGELFGANGKSTLNSTAGEQALRYYRTILKDQKAVHPQSTAFDSVRSGLAFARGEVAMMVNWFGFAAMCEASPDSNLKGKIGIGRVPRGPRGGSAVSLNAYWILGISPASPHPELAWRFLRHCATAKMDKLLTLEGGVGCRKSSWQDPEISTRIPFYPQLEALHKDARELPRLTHWAEVSAVLDQMMIASIETERSEAELLANAEAEISRLPAYVE